jgi:hypothetical protein
MSSTLQFHPDIAAMTAQIQPLPGELAHAVAFHDELRHTAIPYLEITVEMEG